MCSLIVCSSSLDLYCHVRIKRVDYLLLITRPNVLTFNNVSHIVYRKISFKI